MSIATMFEEIKATSSRIHEIDFNDLKFGKFFSDHMLVADYANGTWKEAKILPFGPLTHSPAMSVLHYGQAIFEGLKAYRQPDGSVAMFRPEDNYKRFNHSATRMCMPEMPEDIFMGGLMQLLRLDEPWVPKSRGSSLYIRPFMYATDEFIGVRPSETYRFIIFTCPVGVYYNEPIRVKVEKEYSRVADGGIGSAKAAGNYAAALYPAKLSQEKGYHQLLWTDAKSHEYFEESGTMNVMFLVNNTLITPQLGNTILNGVTRRSVITLAKEFGYNVEERRVSVKEIMDAIEKGELKEAFGVGTAATIANILVINHEGTDYQLPPIETRKLGPKILSHLTDIREGHEADKYGWMVKI